MTDRKTSYVTGTNDHASGDVDHVGFASEPLKYVPLFAFLNEHPLASHAIDQRWSVVSDVLASMRSSPYVKYDVYDPSPSQSVPTIQCSPSLVNLSIDAPPAVAVVDALHCRPFGRLASKSLARKTPSLDSVYRRPSVNVVAGEGTDPEAVPRRVRRNRPAALADVAHTQHRKKSKMIVERIPKTHKMRRCSL